MANIFSTHDVHFEVHGVLFSKIAGANFEYNHTFSYNACAILKILTNFNKFCMKIQKNGTPFFKDCSYNYKIITFFKKMLVFHVKTQEQTGEIAKTCRRGAL